MLLAVLFVALAAVPPWTLASYAVLAAASPPAIAEVIAPRFSADVLLRSTYVARSVVDARGVDDTCGSVQRVASLTAREDSQRDGSSVPLNLADFGSTHPSKGLAARGPPTMAPGGAGDLIDNNILSPLVRAAETGPVSESLLPALKFAERRAGRLHVTDDVVREALVEHGAVRVHQALKRFGIRRHAAPAAGDVSAMGRRIAGIRDGRVPTSVDTGLLVTAERHGFRLVTGDRRVVLDALATGTARTQFRLFNPALSRANRIRGIERVRNALRHMGVQNVHSTTGGR